MNPVVEKHDDIYVVRDDLLYGGTKARFLQHLFNRFDEIVYASPAYGGAQLALAYCARAAGKQATIFVAKRNVPHPRTLEAKAAGAMVYQVPYGYLSHVQAKAKKYARDRGGYYLQFGGDSEETLTIIGQAARMVEQEHGTFDEVWCASGSGVLVRGLQRGFTSGTFYAVQVGAALRNIGKAHVVKHPYPFDKELGVHVPFPSCPNYDRKGWQLCREHAQGKALFWNVLGASPTAHSVR